MRVNPLRLNISTDDLQAPLLRLAWKDERCRRALLSQPKQAIQDACG